MMHPSEMTTEQLEPYAREWMRRRYSSLLPDRTKLAPCKYCGEPMGARARRAHEPQCRIKEGRDQINL